MPPQVMPTNSAQALRRHSTAAGSCIEEHFERPDPTYAGGFEAGLVWEAATEPERVMPLMSPL